MRTKLSAFVLLASVTLAAPMQALAQQAPAPAPSPPDWYGRRGPWHMWGDGYGWHFSWMGPLMMLFFFLVCVAIVYFLFAQRPWGGGMHYGGPPWHMGDRMWSPPTHSALQILNERFARGEIQKDEYEDKKAAILAGMQR